MRTTDDIHDEWLVLRCQAGDDAAVAELVDRWQPRLLRFVARSTGGVDEAADVVQAVWIAVLHGLRSLDDPARFRRWVYQVATHKCADWIRARQRDRLTPSVSTADPVDQRSAVVAATDEVQSLRKSLKSLPPERQALLLMFYVEEMSVAELAQALSLPIGTVKSRLYHARLELKKLLERKNP
jgi:RNA polymerase sigma-70 factor (ECF subfamily)